jgi:hypothetical protein
VTWDFLQRYDESWIWRCTDRHAVSESTRNFAALEECMADASRHGYATTAHAHAGKATPSRNARKNSKDGERAAPATKASRQAR